MAENENLLFRIDIPREAIETADVLSVMLDLRDNTCISVGVIKNGCEYVFKNHIPLELIDKWLQQNVNNIITK